MITLVKDGGVKNLSPESSLIAVLKAQGWIVEGEEAFDGEVDALRAQAEALGLKVHHKAGADKIAKQIEDHLAEVK